MDKVSFQGLILPRGLQIGSILSPLLDWHAEEVITKTKCQCRIENGVATVDVYIDVFDISHVNEYYKRATDLARTITNMIALGKGIAVSLLLDTIIYPHGATGPLMRGLPDAENIFTSFDLKLNSQSLSQSLMSALSDGQLFMAIDDFVVGLTHHHMAEANCRRALDRLRHALAPGVTDKKKGWAIMNNKLNIDGVSLEAIVRVTHANSHGDPIYKPGMIVTPTLTKTFAVINRFIEYRNRGSHPLKEPDFHLLVL